MCWPPCGEVLEHVCRVVASINGPVVTETIHPAPSCRIAEVRRQEPTLPWISSQRPVEVRQIHDRHPLEAKDRVARNSSVARDDVEERRVEGPPGFGGRAICQETVVKDIAV